MATGRLRASLTASNLLLVAGARRQFSEYELLSSAEQIAFRVKTGRESQARTLLGRHLPTGLGSSVTGDSLESLIFFAVAARHTKDMLEHKVLDMSLLDGRDTRASLLSHPIAFVEFRRKGKEYLCFAHGGANPQRFERIISAFAQEFMQPSGQAILDEHIRQRFTSIITGDPRKLPGFARQGGTAKLNQGSAFSETAPQQMNDSPELVNLCQALADTLFRSYHRNVNGETLNEPVHSNSFMRAAIQNWHRQLLVADAARRDRRLGDQAHTDEPLNILPYLAIEQLSGSPEIMFSCCVTSSDPWFFDDRIPEDVRLPGIVIGFYDIADRNYFGRSDFRELQEALRARVAAVSARTMSHKRGALLETAAGEATNISRYWFGEGIAKLLESDDGEGGLNNEDVEGFWSRFVRDLLCAEIAGVKITEVYPFDRAYIIRGTGANPDDSQTSIEISILEAALRSDAPEDRFEFLTSMERGSRPNDDFNFTKKMIKHTTTASAQRDTASPNRIILSTGSAREIVETLEFGDVADSISEADLCLRSLLGATGVGRLKASEEAESDLRKLFSNDGFLYSYRNGINLEQDSPFLCSVDRIYKKLLVKHIAAADADLSADSVEETSSDSKVVTFAFEPTLSVDNRRTDAQGYFVPASEAVTVILVADKDIEKSKQDLAAEREDLRLLISMILRQKLRDEKRDANQIDRRAKVVEAFVDGLLHRVTSELSDSARAIVHQQWDGLRRAIRFDRNSLASISDINSGEVMLGEILRRGDKERPELAHIKDMITARIQEIASREGNSQGITPRFLLPSIPCLEARIPREALRECFDVMLKNAVEAALSRDAPPNPELVLSVSARPGKGERRWVVDLIIENTTAPLSKSIWRGLSAERPVALGENRTKNRSTGVGVFAARHLLQNGLGRDADIRYELLSPTRIQARLSIPARLAGSDQEDEQEYDDQALATSVSSAIDVLYVEDAENIRESGLRFISKSNPELRAIGVGDRQSADQIIRHQLPQLVISDLTILETPNAAVAHSKFGMYFLRSVMERAHLAGRHPPIWILSASVPAEIREKFAETGILFEQLGYRLVDAQEPWTGLLELGTIAILAGVKDLSSRPSLGAFLGDMHLHDRSDDSQPPPAQEPVRGIAGPTAILKFAEFDRLAGRMVEASNAIHIVETDGADPAAALVEWLRNKGARDARSNESTPHCFSNSTIHHNVVLRLAPATVGNLPLGVRYWLLRNNVLANDLAAEPLARHWKQLSKERHGPISRIRHDTHNFIRNVGPPDPAKSVELLEMHCDEIQRLLLMDKETQCAVDELERQPSEANARAVLSHCAGPTEVPFERVSACASELRSLLDDLERHLSPGSNRPRVEGKRIMDSLAAMLELLRPPGLLKTVV